MRECTITIQNSGTGDLVLVGQKLDHGIWTNDRQPPAVIRPEETISVEARDGGDIPIIGSFATGTEGWILYRTLCSEFVGSTTEAFMKIGWNLPFIGIPENPAWVNSYRFDPHRTTGPAEFSERDESANLPPPLKLSQRIGNPGGGDDWSEAFPYLIFGPGVLTASRVAVSVNVNVLNSTTPQSTTIPFTTGPAPKGVPEPMIGTDRSTWQGSWGGEDISIRIVPEGQAELKVTVTEGGNPPQEYITHIKRLLLNYMDINDNPPITRIMPNQRSARTRSGSHLVAREVPQAMIAELPNITIQETTGTQLVAGYALTSESPVFQNVLKNNPAIIAGVQTGNHQIGGDYLELGDATLEMYRYVHKGKVIDVGVRYRNPATGISVAMIDEMLSFYPDVH